MMNEVSLRIQGDGRSNGYLRNRNRVRDVAVDVHRSNF